MTNQEIVIRPSDETMTFMPVMNVQQALKRREQIVDFVRTLMKKGDDYGTIPGSQKSCLLKAGAEKLASFFGLEPQFEPIEEVADWTGKDHAGELFYYIRYRCVIWRDGKRLGMCEGSCNTWESKYRYRWLPEDQVPPGLKKELLQQQDGSRKHTEFEFAVNKAETTGKYGKPAEYWQAFQDAIAKGTAIVGERNIKDVPKKTYTISLGTRLYRCPNPDIADQVNTIQKMAQKRAFIGAMLIATGASQFFTQDLGDNEPDDDTEKDPVDLATAEFKAADKSKKMAAFHLLEKRLNELTGGDDYFYQILREEADAKKPDEIKTLGKAMAAFRRMWMEVERLGNPDSGGEDAPF